MKNGIKVNASFPELNIHVLKDTYVQDIISSFPDIPISKIWLHKFYNIHFEKTAYAVTIEIKDKYNPRDLEQNIFDDFNMEFGKYAGIYGATFSPEEGLGFGHKFIQDVYISQEKEHKIDEWQFFLKWIDTKFPVGVKEEGPSVVLFEGKIPTKNQDIDYLERNKILIEEGRKNIAKRWGPIKELQEKAVSRAELEYKNGNCLWHHKMTDYILSMDEFSELEKYKKALMKEIGKVAEPFSKKKGV